MEVQARRHAGDRSRAKLVTTAQSSPAISKFFPVDNRVESEFDLRTQLAAAYDLSSPRGKE